MTIQELYARIGGNYEQAMKVMRMEKMIDRYVRKLEKSGTCEALSEAVQQMDATRIFEAAHAMKGVCSNLGLTGLASDADRLTEEFREGNPRTMSDEEVQSLMGKIAKTYQTTIEGIKEYEGA